ncbi:MAG: AMP-binding protein [Opitutaceae bacterium]|jgi:phenylacetate-coenzyme A ligase PaaK-like adenylate-forming protein
MSHPRRKNHWHDLDQESTIAWQGRQLHRYLRDCVLPFSLHYRRLFDKAGLTAADIRSVADLRKLPFTSKEDLLPTDENPRRTLDFVLKPDPAVLARRPSVILRALLHGREHVRAQLDREWRPIFMTSTTGRSSEPVPFLYTQHDIAHLALGSGRIVEMGGVQPDERMVNMFPFAPHLAFWYMYYAGIDRNVFALATGGGKVMGTEGNLRAIAKLKPQILVSMPTFLYHVLQQAVEQKVRLDGIRLLVLGGDKVPDGTRRKLGALCDQVGSPGVKIMATYGFTEAKFAWTECPIVPGTPPPGYHLYADQGIVEIINPETGETVPDGEGGEIVWTPLDQRGTVVLRYRTGDRCEHGITWEPCPCCGRRLPRICGKISRVSDVHALRFQKVKGTIVDFNELERALDDLPGVGAWQMELRKAHDDPLDLDELNVHVTATGSGAPSDLDHTVRELLHARFELTPNQIVVHTDAEMRTLQKVGVALKEQKVVDNRPKQEAHP